MENFEVVAVVVVVVVVVVVLRPGRDKKFRSFWELWEPSWGGGQMEDPRRLIKGPFRPPQASWGRLLLCVRLSWGCYR